MQRYEARELALFAQDDWRVGSRLRVNAGLRYDLDPTLRINEFYAAALADTSLAGLETFVSGDRGTDTNNIQPRVGATLDLRGNGELLLRGGWGMYVTRNRPWFQLRSMNQLASPAVLVEDPARLQLYPNVAAIVAGSVPHQLGTVIPDDFVQAFAQNTSVGIAWQIDGATTLKPQRVRPTWRSRSTRSRRAARREPRTARREGSGGDGDAVTRRPAGARAGQRVTSA